VTNGLGAPRGRPGGVESAARGHTGFRGHRAGRFSAGGAAQGSSRAITPLAPPANCNCFIVRRMLRTWSRCRIEMAKFAKAAITRCRAWLRTRHAPFPGPRCAHCGPFWNRLRYVRDLPRNPACLTNTAVSIIRCQPHSPYVPVAKRRFAKRTDEALALLPDPPRSSCNGPASVPHHALQGVRSRCVRVGPFPSMLLGISAQHPLAMRCEPQPLALRALRAAIDRRQEPQTTTKECAWKVTCSERASATLHPTIMARTLADGFRAGHYTNTNARRRLYGDVHAALRSSVWSPTPPRNPHARRSDCARTSPGEGEVMN